ncbi:MAG: DUF1513 domain-containing protein [Planctomycetes bacterium]|nr:DUF1513 domain-containing protein [Planctomycetota bacterium]
MNSIDKNRRSFIATSVVASGLVIASCSPTPNAKKDPPVKGDDHNDETPNPEEQPKTALSPSGIAHGFGSGAGVFFVGRTDIAARKATFSQKITFLGHGLSQNPVKPNSAIVFEKHGPGCVEIDLTSGHTTRVINTFDHREFYGHGAFSPDGKTLYAAETDIKDDYKGVVGVRDGESFEYQGDFETYGKAPHDCHLIDDGATLVFTNSGGPFGTKDLGSVTYVDVKTKKLKRKVEITNPELNAGHMTFLSNGDFVVVSAPRNGMTKQKAPGNISFYDHESDTLRIADDPIRTKMISETLSVAVHEPSGIVAATNPIGNIITFWEFKTGKLVHSTEDYTKPRGVSLTKDGAHFAITHSPTDDDMEIVLLDAETFRPIKKSTSKDTYISGSHIVVI